MTKLLCPSTSSLPFKSDCRIKYDQVESKWKITSFIRSTWSRGLMMIGKICWNGMRSEERKTAEGNTCYWWSHLWTNRWTHWRLTAWKNMTKGSKKKSPVPLEAPPVMCPWLWLPTPWTTSTRNRLAATQCWWIMSTKMLISVKSISREITPET